MLPPLGDSEPKIGVFSLGGKRRTREAGQYVIVVYFLLKINNSFYLKVVKED